SSDLADPAGVVDVELAPLGPLGFLPVDLLAAGLDDVEVEVDAVGIPDQGELGIADLDRDPSDHLAPLAEAGQAEAVAVAGTGVVIGRAPAGAGDLVAPGAEVGLQRDQLGLSQQG